MKKKPYSFKKFIDEFIHYQPLYPERIGEPEEHLGLAIACFPKIKTKQLHIECNESRQIYCEIIDYKNYKDGEIIPLGENPKRHIIVNNRKLKDNFDAQNISLLINDTLDELYNIEKEEDFKELTLREQVNTLRYQNLMLKNYIDDLSDRMDELDSKY